MDMELYVVKKDGKYLTLDAIDGIFHWARVGWGPRLFHDRGLAACYAEDHGGHVYKWNVHESQVEDAWT